MEKAVESVKIHNSDKITLLLSLLRKLCFLNLWGLFFIIIHRSINRQEDAPDLRISSIN